MGICFDKDQKLPNFMGARLDATPLKKNRGIIVFVVGGPGVGKITLCKRLAAKYRLFLVWVSNLLRQEVDSGSELGQYLKTYMMKGEIVPAMVIVQMVVHHMLTQPDAVGYLLVGFPRNKKQAILFNTEVRPPTLLINLYARRVILQERLARRASAETRFDDTTEAICNRVIKYYTNIKSAIGPNKNVAKVVDAETNAEQVFREACVLIEQSMTKLEWEVQLG